MDKFSTLFDDLRINSWSGRHWNFLILVRLSLTITVLVCMRNYPTFQLMCLLSLTLTVQVLLIKGRPFIEPLENKISLFNELMITMYLYTLIALIAFT